MIRLGTRTLISLGLAACLLAACGTSATSTPTVAATLSASSPAAQSPASSPSASGGPGGSGSSGSSAGPGTSVDEPTLLSNLCDMLDPATIASITGLGVGAGKAIAGDSSDTGQCLWSATTSTGLELTAFTEAQIQAKVGGSRPGFVDVPDVGLAAKGGQVSLPGSSITVASLFIDYGTFGILLALNAPGATVDQDVKLAQKLT